MAEEAAKHFVARSFPQCQEAIKKVSSDQSDPKVNHNKAMVEYMSKGGNAGSTLEALGYQPELAVLPDGGGICFDYDGQDIAILNQAVILLHNGQKEQAASLLMALAQNSSSRLKPAIKARIFVLLSICEKSTAISQLNSTMLPDVQPAVQANPTLLNMTQLALGDQTVLENWYKNSTQSVVDRVILHNNLGVDFIVKRSRNYIASLHFVLALRALFSIPDDKLDPFLLETVLFNSGLRAISNAGEEALGITTLDAFLVCQRTMEGSAQLWIRIAQTCASWLVQQTSQGALEAYRRKKLELQNVLKESGNTPIVDVQLMAIPENDEVVPTLKVNDAEQLRLVNIGAAAVKNAILLLQSDPANSSALQSVWLQGAFFERIRGNVAVTLKYSQEIISLYNRQHASKGSQGASKTWRNSPAASSPPPQAVSPTQRVTSDTMLIAVSYAVESLCIVNRTTSAVKLLQSIPLGELLNSSEGASGAKKQNVETLFVNLCIAHIANGSYRQAQAISTTILSRIVTPNQPLTPAGKCAMLLQVVLELAQGSTDRAAELLSKTPLHPPFIN